MARQAIPIGPQHPALKEPECWQLTVDGEVVVDADVRIGYNHRGVEKAAEKRTYIQNLFLIERICGICSFAHMSCYAQGIEELLGWQIPKRGEYLRMLCLEFERIHSHLLWLGVAGHEIGFDTLLHYTWRDRELIQDMLEELSGNRVNYGYNIIGGVRRDITEAMKQSFLRRIDQLEERTKYYKEVALNETTLHMRASRVGVLPKEIAKEVGGLGPTLRASGIATDVRKDDPYASYEEMEFDLCTYDSCDVFGRAVVRVLELIESYKICRQILENLPPGPVNMELPPRLKVPPGETVSRVEAPRGEDIHYYKSNGTEYPERCKFRAPTYNNIMATLIMLRGQYLADVPLIVAAIDPCFSCTDRVTIIDKNEQTVNRWSWNELRAYSAKWAFNNKDLLKARGL